MRIKLSLAHRNRAILPKDYEYLISSWIYNTIENSDADFAHWLHQQGHSFNNREYKLFTFSPIFPIRYNVPKGKGQFILDQGPSELYLSFMLPEAMHNFVTGLFSKDHFSLGDRQYQVDFKIQSIEILPKPVFTDNMRFRLLKPCLISEKEAGKTHAQYRSPDDPGYERLFLNNLLGKIAAFRKASIPGVTMQLNPDPEWALTVLSEPIRRKTTIKGSDYIGYIFDFEIKAPTNIIEMGYYAGFGEKNSGVGFGYVAKLD